MALTASGVEGTALKGEDYYEKLGVAKLINAAGTYTALTASLMPPQVEAAVAEAARHYVRLSELQHAAGEYLAKKLQCGGALVTAGAASALTLGTAASMTLGSLASTPETISGFSAASSASAIFCASAASPLERSATAGAEKSMRAATAKPRRTMSAGAAR